MSEIVFDHSWAKVEQIKPGAKERIEAKLKLLPEINAKRPCKKCIHSFDSKASYYGTSCRGCNFNHDNFKPKKVG